MQQPISGFRAEMHTCWPAHIHRDTPVSPYSAQRCPQDHSGSTSPDKDSPGGPSHRRNTVLPGCTPPRLDPSPAAPKMITRVWLLFEHKPRDHEREGATGRRRLDQRAVRPGWQAAAMRPALKSGLLPVWRDRDTLQIGIDPRRAVALSGMGHAAFVIGLLDGSRDRDQVIAAAAGRGIPVQTTERILTLLAAGGALDDFPASTLRELPLALRAKLAPELATTSLAYRDGDGGARALARRRAAVVRIEGDRRIGRAAARLLKAAGVGQVHFVRPPADGATPASGGEFRDSGRPRSAAMPSGAARPIAAPGDPGSDRRSGAGRESRSGQPLRPGITPVIRPDLIVLAGRQPIERLAQLARAPVPHLAVMAGEAIGVVGPLVVPGHTACLLCLDYVRAGNDPAWPLILSQIVRKRPEPPACDAVLATAVAAQAAAQALTAIEHGPLASAATNGTLELVLPDWRWRRRTWPPHPACPCGSHTVM